MRSTTLSRRAAAVALAGALAFGVSACSEDEGTDVDTEVSEGEVVDDAASEVDDAASEVEEGVDDAASEMSEEMTEAETEG